MRTLAIDTSGAACSIALFDERGLIAYRHEVVGRGHAERLIPWIADLPDGGRAGRILCGCGPGSFTGVRVGIAAARALALGWSVPVDGVSSLALIAAQASGAAVTVAVEGGHGEVFAQDFSDGLATTALKSLSPSEAAQIYRHDLVFGSGAIRLVEARGFGEARAVDADARCAPTLSAATLSKATPIYGRGADAKPMATTAA